MTTYYGIEPGEKYKPWLWPLPKDTKYIGKEGIYRKDGFMKASGTVKYCRDLTMPGMLYAKTMEAPHAHCKIIAMDTSRAEAVPGVRKIIRYDEDPIWYGIFDSFRAPLTPMALPTEAWFSGQLCGATIIADTELACEEAMRILEKDTEWERLPFYLDWDEAIKPGSTPIYPDRELINHYNPGRSVEFPDFTLSWTGFENKNNMYGEEIQEYGDADSAMTEATNTLEFSFKESLPDTLAGIEAQVQIAKYIDASNTIVETWENGQGSNSIHQTDGISHCHYSGGRFGHAFNVLQGDLLAKRAALETNQRPVCHLHDRSHFYWMGEEFGTYKMKVGYEDNGKITAIKIQNINCCGILDPENKICKSTGCENIHVTKTYPYQNIGPYSCYRHGGAQAAFLNEICHRIAEDLNMDPAEVAMINDGADGHSMEWINENVKKKYGFDATRDSLNEVIDIGKKAIDWNNKWHEPGTKLLPNGKYHGIGFMYCNSWHHRADDNSSFLKYRRERDMWGPIGLGVYKSGKVFVEGAHNEVGVNRGTTYQAIIADEIGLNFDDVVVKFIDEPEGSRSSFRFRGHGGSRGLISNAVMAIRLAQKAKKMILEKACKPRMNPGGYFDLYGYQWLEPAFPNKTPEELDIKDSMVFEIANPNNKQPISAITTYLSREMFVTDVPPDLDEELHTYPMGRQCYFMEVEVDPDTGHVDVIKDVCVYDAGKIISPETCHSQMIGGTYMGYGRSRVEEVFFDPNDGVRLNDDLINYPINLIGDIKGDIDVHLIETGLNWAPYGMGGIGESPTAVQTHITRYAVHNAIGKWLDEGKTTPEYVLKALGKV